MVPDTLVKKFIAILSTIMLLACCVTGYITYRLHLNISEKEIARQFAQRVDQVAARVDLRLQDVYRLSDQIVINPVIVELLKKVNAGEPLGYEEHAALVRQLNPIIINFPNLMAFYIFDMQGNYYMPGNALLVNDLGKMAREQVNAALQGSDGELVWVKGNFSENDTGPFSRNEIGMILAARWLKDAHMDNYGVLIMALNQSILANDLNMAIKGDNSRVYLFGNYSLLYTDETEPEGIDMNLLRSIEAEGVRNVNGTPYLFAQSETERTNFKLISRISMQTLQEKSKLLMAVTFASALVSVLLAVALAFLASRKMLYPLKKLVLAMRKVREGNLAARVDIRTNDEFRYIGDSFNSMVENVDALIKEVYVKQLREREAELTSLQAQLNPHFLYNTLDMIHSRLYLQDDKVTAGLVVSLSNLLRYALEPASSETSLADEFKQINNYLRLQKARYEHDLEIVIEIEKGVEQCGIIRLLLQPLVENVFVHAFRDHTDLKLLTLQAYRDQGQLIIDICDNGCGFSEEAKALLDVKRMKAGGGKAKSLGIHNVIRRMELYYGAPYGVEFDSAPQAGTRVRLRLPCRMLANRQKEGVLDA